jgi:UDP-N-acetylglucosamine 2-epimerase (non-hydrolysing)
MSGGIQEKTTFWGIPCLTLRDNTERPIICTNGTNRLVTREISEIKNAILEPKKGSIPPLWDGFATERVLEVIHANHG